MNKEALEPSHIGNNRVKVLFVAGPTRSGSTILSNILGQINGIFHAGEVIEAWDRGRTWKCSCGQLPSKCRVWSPILKSVDDHISRSSQKEIIRIQGRLSRSHKVIMGQWRSFNRANPQALEAFYEAGLIKLYALIKTGTKAKIIVDSSKNIGYAQILNRIEEIDLYIVHLVRDSRATTFSWSKKKKELWKAGPLQTALQWNSRNIAAEVLRKERPDKYIHLRYEDFIRNPRQGVIKILSVLNHTKEKLPFVSPNEVYIGSSHGLCGNPGRYHQGVEKLVMDNRWNKMNKMDGLVATLLTWPLLLKYKYPIRYGRVSPGESDNPCWHREAGNPVNKHMSP